MKYKIDDARKSIVYKLFVERLLRLNWFDEYAFAMQVRKLLNNSEFNLPMFGEPSATPESYLLCAFNWEQSPQGHEYWRSKMHSWRIAGER